MKDRLNAVGCGFCLANWTQSDIHLPNGITRSCGLPFDVQINEDEVKNNFKALHNPNFRKISRKEMLEDKQPELCDFCWMIEDTTTDDFERVRKSNDSWSKPHFDTIKNSKWDEDVDPKYLEVGFSSECNFKCLYCHSEYSSSWGAEIKKGLFFNLPNYSTFGNFTRSYRKPKKKDEQNSYRDAFWEWWPELYQSLHTFRVTGGEPLLADDFWSILDFIIQHENPNRNLSLCINTNLDNKNIVLLIEKLNTIISENRVKEVIIYASIDGFGAQAEYVRNGLNADNFWQNLNEVLLLLPKVSVVIMTTYSLFTVFSYNDLLNKIYEINVMHNNPDRFWGKAIISDPKMLYQPELLSTKLLPDEYKSLILDSLNDLDTEVKDSMLPHELDKIKIISDFAFSETTNSEINHHRDDFVTFIDQIDERFKCNFLETFPELTDFYNNIKNNI